MISLRVNPARIGTRRSDRPGKHQKIVFASLLSVALLSAMGAWADEIVSSEQIIEQLDTGKAVKRRTTRGMVKTTGGVHSAATEQGAPSGSVILKIQFEYNSSELSYKSVAQLNELGKALNASTLAGNKFEISGHTDATGSRNFNQSLSTRRAEAVTHYLYTQLGINRERLSSRGWGEDRLLISNNPYHPDNRRVEIINLGALQ